MGTAELKLKLKMIWHILSSSSVFIFTQKNVGAQIETAGFGDGSIQDMLLMSVEFKKQLTGFTKLIEEAATETGELHALRELQAALDTLENK